MSASLVVVVVSVLQLVRVPVRVPIDIKKGTVSELLSSPRVPVRVPVPVGVSSIFVISIFILVSMPACNERVVVL